MLTAEQKSVKTFALVLLVVMNAEPNISWYNNSWIVNGYIISIHRLNARVCVKACWFSDVKLILVLFAKALLLDWKLQQQAYYILLFATNYGRRPFCFTAVVYVFLYSFFAA